MWPFTSRRIFGNRWWAIGFVIFVCWQVIDVFSDPPPSNASVPAVDATGMPVDQAQLDAIAERVNALQNAN